jgi:hypothetical protein
MKEKVGRKERKRRYLRGKVKKRRIKYTKEG